MEEGYPRQSGCNGNLYLTDKNELKIDYLAKTDKGNRLQSDNSQLFQSGRAGQR
jgi:hypothetical protein